MKPTKDKVDFEQIMREHEEALQKGISSGSMTIDDIERQIGDSLNKLKDSLLISTEEIIQEEGQSMSDDGSFQDCPLCKKALKKTKK